MNTGVRERGREILRAELADAAADHCATHDVDTVTVDDLARAIGVSRATFFRYFHSKEDAVLAAVRGSRHSLAAALRDGGPTAGENAWHRLRAAMAPVVDDARAHPDRLRARIALIGRTTSLRARLAVDRAEERELLATVLTERIGDAATARAMATTAIAAVDLAWHLWAQTPGTDLGDQLDRAFELTGSVATVVLES